MTTYISDAGVDILELLQWAQGSELLGSEPRASAKKAQNLHISRIRFDYDNPRSVFLDIAQFASSLAQEMIEPLEIAINSDGTVKLLEGHRRFIALLYLFRIIRKYQANDLAACIPCIIGEETENADELLSRRLRKNDERESFHAIDEARALQRLMTSRSCNAKTLASQLRGKYTEKYIASRISLMNLASREADNIPALDYFMTGSISEAEALEVARLPKDRQKEALTKICIEQIKLKELRSWIDSLSLVPATSEAPQKRTTKKRSPDFAAAVTIPEASNALTLKTILLEMPDGTVTAKITISSKRRTLKVSMTPDKVSLTPELIAIALKSLADKIKKNK